MPKHIFKLKSKATIFKTWNTKFKYAQTESVWKQTNGYWRRRTTAMPVNRRQLVGNPFEWCAYTVHITTAFRPVPGFRTYRKGCQWIRISGWKNSAFRGNSESSNVFFFLKCFYIPYPHYHRLWLVVDLTRNVRNFLKVYKSSIKKTDNLQELNIFAKGHTAEYRQ